MLLEPARHPIRFCSSLFARTQETVMTPSIRWWAAAFLMLVPSFLSGQAIQTGSASVEGIVVKLGTNDPISGVVVELSRPAAGPNTLPEAITATTGDDGKFIFRSLEPGEYRLVAAKPGGTYN